MTEDHQAKALRYANLAIRDLITFCEAVRKEDFLTVNNCLVWIHHHARLAEHHYKRSTCQPDYITTTE